MVRERRQGYSFSIYIPPELHSLLQRISLLGSAADRRSRSVGQWIRKAIVEKAEREGV